MTSLRQIRQLMLNPTVKEGSLQFMFTSEETLLASYLHAEDYVEHARRFNPYLGAFVTAHGRRRLHEAMFQIGTHRILYCDTDSLIYVEGTRFCGDGNQTRIGQLVQCVGHRKLWSGIYGRCSQIILSGLSPS